MDIRVQIKNLAAFVAAKKEKIFTILAGQAFYRITGWLFDNPFYIFIIAKYGMVKGWIAMTILSAILNIILIRFYNKTEKDWLGIEAIKKVKKYDGKSQIRKILTKIIRKSDAVAFIVLSIFEDPFITMTYLKSGSYGKMEKKDWKIFLYSTILSNGYWTLRNSVIIEAFRYLWKSFAN